MRTAKKDGLVTRGTRRGLALVVGLSGVIVLACSSNKTIYVDCAGAAACYHESCATDPSSPAGCPACNGSITDFTGNQTDVCGNVSTPTSCKYNSSCSLFGGALTTAYALSFTANEYRGTFALGACKYTVSGARLDQCPIADAGGAPDTSVKSQCDRSALCSSACCAQHQCVKPTTTSACACLSNTDCYQFPCDSNPNACAQGVPATPSCNTTSGLCGCGCG